MKTILVFLFYVLFLVNYKVLSQDEITCNNNCIKVMKTMDDTIFCLLEKEFRIKNAKDIDMFCFSSDITTALPESIKTQVFNVVTNKILEYRLYGIPREYIAISPSEVKGMGTMLDCVFFIKKVVNKTIDKTLFPKPNIDDILKYDLVNLFLREQIITKKDSSKITAKTSLSEFFVSGFSIRPLLKEVLLKNISSKKERKYATILLSEASTVETIQDCIDLIKDNWRKYENEPDTLTGILAKGLNALSGKIIVTRSSDELIKPFSLRSSSSLYYGLPLIGDDQYINDALGGFDFGFLFNLLPFFDGVNFNVIPYYEAHKNSTVKSESHVESHGIQLIETSLFKSLWNLKLTFMADMNFAYNFISKVKYQTSRGYISFGFEPHNTKSNLRYYLPSYSPIGASMFVDNKRFEVLSWVYFPTFGFEQQDSLGTIKDVYLGRVDAILYFFERIFEFNYSVQIRASKNLNPTAFQNYIFKINIPTSGTNTLARLRKGIKLTLGIEFQKGTNPIQGFYNRSIWKITTGINL